MDYNRSYDLVDGLGIVVSVLSAAVLTGIATISLFGYSASGTLATISGFGVSYAFAVAIASLIGLMAYNDVGKKDLMDARHGRYSQAQEDFVGLVLGVLAFVGIEFLSEVQNFVTSSDAIALGVTVLMAIPAFIIVHRMN